MKSKMETKLKKLDQVTAYKVAKDELNRLYETDKGKHFVHHLIYSFNSSPVYFIALNKREELKDCLTASAVHPVFTNVNSMPDHLRDLLDEIRNEIEVNDALIDKYNDQVKEYVKSNALVRIAMTCKGTDKIIGIDEYQALCDFIDEQCKLNNSSIRTMMNILHPNNKVTKPTKKIIKKSPKVNKTKVEKPTKDMNSLLSELVTKYQGNGKK